MPDNIEHGTYGGAQKCRKKYGTACDACKRAYADYQAEYRARNPKTKRMEYRRQAINRKAMMILRDRHRSEYQEIVNELLRSKDAK